MSNNENPNARGAGVPNNTANANANTATADTDGNRNDGNRNNRRFNGGRNNNHPRFKGKIEGLATLGMKSDKRTDLFILFQNDIHDHIISNFEYASDVAPLIKEFSDPMKNLMRHIPNKKN